MKTKPISAKGYKLITNFFEATLIALEKNSPEKIDKPLIILANYISDLEREILAFQTGRKPNF